ncbi:hypothetical protein BsWGS_19958 [Bradybaena similaris]
MVTESTGFSGAPFGVGSHRFSMNGIHPRRQIPGMVTQTTSLGTRTMLNMEQKGLRDHVTSEQNGGSHQTKIPGLIWARQLETERLAAQPHLLFKEQWQQNQMLKRKLGPGSYEIKDFIQLANEKPRSEKGLYETMAPRFVKNQEGSAPGPGTYGGPVLGDKAKRSFSTRAVVQHGDRDKIDTSVGSGLGPGTYSFKSSTDQLLDKVTSLHGPYRLFSGDRNKPISQGHLAVPKPSRLGPGQYNIRSFVDDLHGPQRKYQGRFGKLAQYPDVPTDRIFLNSKTHHPQMTDVLGPGAYHIRELSKPASTNSPGFLSSSRRDDKMAQKFFTRNFNPVGPGRYDIQKLEEAQHVNGHSSVFKSQTGTLSLQVTKALHERIHGNSTKVEKIFPYMQKAMARPITAM